MTRLNTSICLIPNLGAPAGGRGRFFEKKLRKKLFDPRPFVVCANIAVPNLVQYVRSISARARIKSFLRSFFSKKRPLPRPQVLYEIGNNPLVVGA